MKILIIITFLVSNVVYARTVGRVFSIKGNSFLFSKSNSPRTIKFAQKIPDLAEIMIESESHLSFKDSYGRIVHMGSGAHIKIFSNLIEIKSGRIWVENKNKSTLTLTTPNGIIKNIDGQGIYSFDPVSNKTQAVVLSGESQVANINEPGLGVALDSGYFSLIDINYNNGIPRGATKIGSSTYVSIRNQFSHLNSKSLKEYRGVIGVQKSNRSIASVGHSPEATDKKQGKIIYRKSYQNDQKIKSESAFGYYQKVKKNSHLKTSKSAQIRYFGNANVKRLPSSVTPSKVHRIDPARQNLADKEFQNSLNNMFKNNKRHDQEVNQLIDELETFDAKYQKEY